MRQRQERNCETPTLWKRERHSSTKMERNGSPRLVFRPHPTRKRRIAFRHLLSIVLACSLGQRTVHADFCEEVTILDSMSGTFSDGSGSSDYEDSTYCSWWILPGGSENFASSYDIEVTFDFLQVRCPRTSTVQCWVQSMRVICNFDFCLNDGIADGRRIRYGNIVEWLREPRILQQSGCGSLGTEVRGNVQGDWEHVHSIFL